MYCSQVQFPGLADQILVEAVMRLGFYQLVSRLFINAPGGNKNAIGPQSDLPIADAAGETGAFIDQFAADSEASRLRLDIEEPELCCFLVALDKQDRAQDCVFALGDPCTL